MKIIVLKFGGTSVGSIQRIKKVSKIIKSYSKKYRVIVLSSAMSGTTNKLINMSKKISENFPDNEYDALVSAGEQISCSLLAGHLAANGLNSRSWMAWQIPIITDEYHEKAKILNEDIASVRNNETKNVSMKRMIDPEEIAELIVFLCSNSGRSISGQSLGVCGNTETLR